jgi:outer membrane protein OmpA-like peptidoglycan-associated protein
MEGPTKRSIERPNIASIAGEARDMTEPMAEEHPRPAAKMNTAGATKTAEAVEAKKARETTEMRESPDGEKEGRMSSQTQIDSVTRSWRRSARAWKIGWLGIVGGIALGAPVLAQTPAVTDLSTVDVAIIEPGDIVEALAVPRGTRIRPGNRPRVRLPVYFEFNSAELKPEARSLLVKVGKALNTSDLEGYSFSVEGHTDSVGGEIYNEELSRDRAEAVKSFLQQEGVPDGRLLSVGRGEGAPVDSNGTIQGRQRNRRVEIINMGTGS